MRYCLVSKYILTSVILLLFAVAGYSREEFDRKQDYYTSFKNINVNDGLSSNLVLNIIQDRYGIMWFATSNGLTRYDGYSFTVYQTSKDDAHCLSDNFVTSLAEDAYGNLWIGTQNGLNRYDRLNNRFVQYFTDRKNSNGLKNSHIKALYADKDGYLWVEEDGGFLGKLDIKSEVWEHQHRLTGQFEGDYYYHHIFEDSKGNLWIAGRGTGSCKVPSKKIKALYHIPSYASCCVETLDGKIFFGTYDNEFERYNPETDSGELVTRTGISEKSAICDNNNILWFGGKGGIAQVDLKRKKITRLAHNSLNPQSLASNEVFCLYKDRNGCIWVGTDKGVSIYSENLNIFRYYKQINKLDYGMTSNAITRLMQDNDGLMWVATTDSGVDTFSLDNEKFGNLKYDLLTKNIDRQTFEREKDVLKQYYKHDLIGTESDDSKRNIDYIFQSYQHFQQAPLQFARLNENIASALYQDKEGKIYVGLWSHVGFNIYDKKKGVFKRHAMWGAPSNIHFPQSLGNPFGGNWYTDFLEDSNGTLWVTTWETTGLNIFDRRKGEFLPKHYIRLNNIYKGNLFQFAYDPTRHRMILADGGYYGYYDFKAKSYTKYSQTLPAGYPNKELLEEYFKYSDVRLSNIPLGAIYLDFVHQNNVTWIASHEYIMKHTLDDDKFKVIYNETQTVHPIILTESKDHQHIWESKKNVLKRIDVNTNKVETIDTVGSESITSLYEDSNGLLWIGTKNGIYFYNTTENKLYFSELNLINVSSIAEYDQHVYVGCSIGLIKLKNQKIVKEYPFSYPEANGIPGNDISSIYIGSNGIIWICTNDGLVKLSSKNNEITVFNYDPSDQFSILDNSVFNVCEDGDLNLWVSTTKGTCLLEHNSTKFIDLTVPGDKAIASRLQHRLMQDKLGNIWVGSTQEGISVLNPKTDRFKHYSHQSWNENSISDNYILFFFQDSRSNIWVGTRKGLNKYNPTKDNFIRITELSGYQTYNMQEDNADNLWLSTHNGLLCLDSLGSITRVYQNFPGLQGNEFSLAGCKLNNGYLAFGGDLGFNIFNPERLTNNSFEPRPIVLSNLIVRDSIRYFDLNGLETLDLSHRENAFSISFCSTDYEYTNLISYRYMMDGVDDGWIYTKAPILTAKYNSIPYGNHTFIVEVSNCFGEWVGVQKSLNIHIATPWYYQWWFISLLILFIGGIIYATIRIRERQLRLENVRLESIVEKRTSELKETNQKLIESEKELRAMNDSKNKFFSIISHDLRNPLKALNLTARSLFEQYDNLTDKEKYNIISIIHKTTQQTGAFVENLLTWVVSQMNMLKPNLKKTSLASLVDSNIEFLQIEAQKKNIRLVVKVASEIYVWADDNLFSTILRNLISNAIHYSFSSSEITISAKENNGEIEVSVADQGVGISEENLKRIFSLSSKIQTKGTDNEKGTGLGLIIVQEFVHMHNGKIWVESEINKGSIFTFTLKKYTENDGTN